MDNYLKKNEGTILLPLENKGKLPQYNNLYFSSQKR